MLKIEKSRNDGIYVTIRKKQHFVNRSFLFAFAIAFALHLFAILIFQVRVFFFQDHGILAPVVVESSLTNGEIVADTGSKKLNQIHLEPAASDPQIQSLAMLEPKHERVFESYTFNQDNLFGDFEKDAFLVIKETQQETKKGPYIVVSGPLSEISLLHNGITTDKTLNIGPLHYAVKVDNHSGRIFWYMDKGATNTQAEQILLNMRFQQDPNRLITSGEIEVAL